MSRVLVNVLGDVRAEADHRMLGSAFYETPDYFSLLDSDDKVVAVGRRGTGKSALTYRLAQQWRGVKNNVLLVVAPDEHETLALAPLIRRTGSRFLEIRAATRLLWRYGFLMDAAQALSTRYKARDHIATSEVIAQHLHAWGKLDVSFFAKLRALLRRHLKPDLEQADVIGHLADVLQIARIEKDIRPALAEIASVKILVDRLDEGFDPSEQGIAFIDGVVSASIDIATAFRGSIRPLVFLRDNIYRAVALYDQDFTRNIEGQTLRLHWDATTLFYLVCNRLRTGFHDTLENNKRLWNKYCSYELHGDDGFKQCLQFTLYRPRDILILLNAAFESASKRDQSAATVTISKVDIEASAKTISTNRLDDLKKEYRAIFPSIGYAVDAFTGHNPELTLNEVYAVLDGVITQPPRESEVQLELAIMERSEELVRALYSVGFFGIYDVASSSYVFRHDGKRQDVDLEGDLRLSVHPCYWIALNLTRNSLDPEEATEINDEYEMKVVSQTPAIRNSRLGRVISDLARLNPGADDSSAFEDWCLDAVKICFAGKLDNVELHPNKTATNRRDIVGTNLAASPFWRRVLEDYETRQVIFEVKNYEELTADDYRQVLSYLSGTYGRLAFVVTRGGSVALEKEKDLDWVRAIYHEHKRIVVRLTGKFLTDILAKLRNPQKHDAGDNLLAGLLDTYERLYLSLGAKASPRAKKRSRRTRAAA